jgi:hypothetical protein
MENRLALELVGYFASALIAVSLMMTSILRLRLINLAGAALFAIYGLLIQAYPVAILNGLIVGVNGWHLIRMWRAKEFFQILPLKPESAYLPYFLEFYDKEIRRILPDFQYRRSENQLALFVLRDCAPVGVFIAERAREGRLNVVLDFVVPGYRDLKLGRYLFCEQAGFFQKQGVREIIVAPRTREFGAYLVKVGFEPALRDAGAFSIRFDARSK